MLINNVSIKSFGAELLNLDIQNAELITKEEWPEKLHSPFTINQNFYYKKINVELLVSGTDREDVLTKCSNLKNKLKKCTLKFHELQYFYDCTLENERIEKSVRINRVRLFCTLNSSYAYKPQVTESLNRILIKTINVSGNLETPAIVEITPSVEAIDLVITGLSDDPIIIKNLKQNKKIIISGEDCTVLQDGINKFSDTDLWEFPRLRPGPNTITLSKNTMDIMIKYKGRWI